MVQELVAHVALTIDAPRAKVWDALVTPETIKQYMAVTDVVSEWREGSSIVWRSEWLGKSLESRGTILRLEPPSDLEYTYSRPIFNPSAASGSPRHFHRVSISLSEDGSQTRISVVHDNNATTRELEHSEGGWRLTLNNLKALLEGTRQ